MELSELVMYNDKLLAPDDRTGLVFQIENDQAIPLYVLMEGNGKTTKVGCTPKAQNSKSSLLSSVGF
jgi:soluble calcium-activated nucleotidase 1